MGVWALMIQNRGFGLQTSSSAQTLSFVGGSEGLGGIYAQFALKMPILQRFGTTNNKSNDVVET